MCTSIFLTLKLVEIMLFLSNIEIMGSRSPFPFKRKLDLCSRFTTIIQFLKSVWSWLFIAYCDLLSTSMHLTNTLVIYNHAISIKSNWTSCISYIVTQISERKRLEQQLASSNNSNITQRLDGVDRTLQTQKLILMLIIIQEKNMFQYWQFVQK